MVSSTSGVYPWTRLPLTPVASRVYLRGCQCQPRHAVRTGISCPRTLAARAGTGPRAHSRNRPAIHCRCPLVRQDRTCTAPGTSSRRGRSPGEMPNKAPAVMSWSPCLAGRPGCCRCRRSRCRRRRWRPQGLAGCERRRARSPLRRTGSVIRLNSAPAGPDPAVSQARPDGSRGDTSFSLSFRKPTLLPARPGFAEQPAPTQGACGGCARGARRSRPCPAGGGAGVTPR